MWDSDIRVLGTVVSSGLGKASTGTEQVAVCFEYSDEQGQPRRITWYGYFSSDKAIEIADKALCALGWDPAGNEFRYFDLNSEDPQVNPILGKRAQLVLGEEEDQQTGDVRLKVKFVNSAGGGLGLKERMSPEDAQAFSARMRARIGGVAPAASRPRPAAATGTPAAAPRGQAPAQRQAPAARTPSPRPAQQRPAPAAAPAPEGVDFDDIPF